METKFETTTAAVIPSEHTYHVWECIKKKYSDAIILVREDDQYFTFGSDAEMISLVMDIELKEKAPVQIGMGSAYEVETLLRACMGKGYRIALCDRLGK